MKNTQESLLHTKSKKTNNSNSLIEYKEVENTPFTVVTLEKENSEEKEYYVMFGKYRLSNDLGTFEKAMEEAETIDWWKIMGIAHAITETIIDEKNIKNEISRNSKKNS